MVGAECPQLAAEGVVELGKAVQKDHEWPRACVCVVQLDAVHGCRGVMDGSVVGVHTAPVKRFVPRLRRSRRQRSRVACASLRPAEVQLSA